MNLCPPLIYIYIKLDFCDDTRSTFHVKVKKTQDACVERFTEVVTWVMWKGLVDSHNNNIQMESRIMFLLSKWQHTTNMCLCACLSVGQLTLLQKLSIKVKGKKTLQKNRERDRESKCTLKLIHTISFLPHYVHPVSDRSPSITNPDSLEKHACCDISAK